MLLLSLRWTDPKPGITMPFVYWGRSVLESAQIFKLSVVDTSAQPVWINALMQHAFL